MSEKRSFDKANVAVRVKNVSKTFMLGGRSFDTLKDRLFNYKKRETKQFIKALDDINFEIYAGECIGVIGRNGSGKSTLTKIMSGAFVPDKGGVVEKNGTSLLLNLGVGFSHELTARENIYVNGSTLGMRLSDINEKFDEILAFAELEEFVDTKIKYFSTGMIQRLSFSIAVNASADIIFLDEVFAVGDTKFKERATKELESNWIKGRTAIIVSHSLMTIKKYCNRVMLIDKGQLVYFGDAEEALRLYDELG